VNSPDISIVIVSYNTSRLLAECLESVERESSGLRCETIVVDNASTDDSVAMVRRQFPHVRLVASAVNLGFAPANNNAFGLARGRYVVLLNSDAFLQRGSLRRAMAHMDACPDVGLGGGRLVGRDGTQQPSSRAFPSFFNDLINISGLAARFPRSRVWGRIDRTWADPMQAAQVDWVPGAFVIVRRDLLERLGAFDRRMFLYYEEVDLCRRIKASGYQVWYWPDITVVHIGGESSKTVRRLSMSSSGAQLTLWRMRSELVYYRKHHGLGGAWMKKALESSWHGLRGWLHRSAGSAVGQAKRAESQAVVQLMRRAWHETDGGRTVPAHPW
jgi:GT2 family glycosyltransferase